MVGATMWVQSVSRVNVKRYTGRRIEVRRVTRELLAERLETILKGGCHREDRVSDEYGVLRAQICD